MITLLVDAGNSRIKWARLCDGELSPAQAAPYPAPEGRETLPPACLHSWRQLPSAIRVIACNVAGESVQSALLAWIKEHGPGTIEFVVASASALGVHNAYGQPETLGADRWAALIAARHLLRGPACVLDFGTAITIDVLDGKGRHLGGVIGPGIRLMQHSLSTSTSGIGSAADPRARASGADWLGAGTGACVHGGTLLAATGLADHALRRAQRLFDEPLQCVFTGGGAGVVLAQLQDDLPVGLSCHHEPDWVLKGLRVIAEEAQRSLATRSTMEAQQ